MARCRRSGTLRYQIGVHFEVNIGSVEGDEYRFVDDPANVSFRHLHIKRFDVVRCQPDAPVRAKTVDAERRVGSVNANTVEAEAEPVLPRVDCLHLVALASGRAFRSASFRPVWTRERPTLDSPLHYNGEGSKRRLPVAATNGDRIATLKTSVGELGRAGAAGC